MENNQLQAETMLGKYKIIRKLGAGGMADVYEAEDTVMGRRVALKVLPPELARDPDRITRFEKEVRHLAALNHPNIVTVYDVGHDSKLHYYTMALLTGQNLKQKIANKIAPEMALSIVRKISHALEFAHNNGFVHRDIKPENIMFDDKNEPILTDFGIARAIGSSARMTATGMSIGTPHYMSPEQARGEEATPAADFYSLGIVLYECLCGKVPFEGENATAIGIMHIQDFPDPLPDHLVSLQPLVDGLLDKNPNKRFSSAFDVEQSIGMLFTNSEEHQQKAVRSKKASLIWALCGAFLALAATAGFWLYKKNSLSLPLGDGILPVVVWNTEKPSENNSEQEEPSPQEAQIVQVKPRVLSTAEEIDRMKRLTPSPWLEIQIPKVPLAQSLNTLIPVKLLKWAHYGRFIDGYQSLDNNGFRISMVENKHYSDTGERLDAHLELVGRLIPGKIQRAYGYLVIRPPEDEKRKERFLRDVNIPAMPFDVFFDDEAIHSATISLHPLRMDDLKIEKGEIALTDFSLNGLSPKGLLLFKTGGLQVKGGNQTLTFSPFTLAGSFLKEGIVGGMEINLQFDGAEFVTDKTLNWQAGHGRIELKQHPVDEKELGMAITANLSNFWVDPDLETTLDCSDVNFDLSVTVPNRQMVQDYLELLSILIQSEMDLFNLNRNEENFLGRQLVLMGLEILSDGAGIPESSLSLQVGGEEVAVDGKLIWEEAVSGLSVDKYIDENDISRFAELKLNMKGNQDVLSNWRFPSELGDLVRTLISEKWVIPGLGGLLEIPFEGKQNKMFVNGKDLRRLDALLKGRETAHLKGGYEELDAQVRAQMRAKGQYK